MRSIFLFLLFPLSAAGQLTPTLLTTLGSEVDETSGLMLLNGTHWTLNDAGNTPHLFQIDPDNGSVLRTVEVSNAPNIDWEDIATDGNYVYIGDVGNNSGSRTDLRILRFPAELLIDPATTQVEVELIEYAYVDQQSFEPAMNANDRDCEAIIAKDDSLFLFTKNWVDQQTRLYALPAIPGNHTAMLRGGHDVQGMVTGASYDPIAEQIILVGYTNGLFVPFMVHLTGYSGNAFFSGSVVRDSFSLVFVQIEGVEWHGSDQLRMTNEASPFSQPRLWSMGILSVSVDEASPEGFHVYPNPVNGSLRIDGIPPNTMVSIFDQLGREVHSIQTFSNSPIDVGHLPGGIYMIRSEEEGIMRSARIEVWH